MKLTSEQRDAIETRNSLAVIASAGTGKTTVLTQRYLNCLTQRGAEFHQIIAFTFTEKATREMKMRVIKSGNFDPSTVPQIRISTIHGFCHRLLQQYGLLLKLKSDFGIIDENSHSIALKTSAGAWINHEIESGNETIKQMVHYYGGQTIRNTVFDLLSGDIWTLPQHQIQCLNPESELDAQTVTLFLKQISSFALELQNQRVINKLISYDDLELLTLRLLTDHSEVRAKLQKLYKHILVDEYQDISPRQFELIKLLFNPALNEIFIVGDPKQSIYRFRNAELQLFFDMVKIIENSGGKTIHLAHTFRTPIRTQEYFNHIFPKILGNDLFKSGQAHMQHPEARVMVRKLDSAELSTSQHHDTVAEDIARTITSLLQNGTKPDRIAILCPTKSKMTHYESALAQRSIPVSSQRSKNLFDQPEILCIWHLMNFLAGDQSRITQAGILHQSPFQFSEGFISHLLKSEMQSLFTGQTPDLFASQNERQAWQQLSALITQWSRLTKTLYAADMYQTLILKLFPSADILLFEPLLQIIQSWQKQNIFFLHQAKSWLAKLPELKLSTPLVPDDSGVQIITVHGSKGLEFQHVFVVPAGRDRTESPLYCIQENEGFVFKLHDYDNLETIKPNLTESESFKLVKAYQAEQEAAEIKRLIYVALTRTELSLHLYPSNPSKARMAALDKNPLDTANLKNFNDWLYWLSLQNGVPPESSTDAQLQLDYPLDNLKQDSPVLTPTHSEHVPTFSVSELEVLDVCAKQFQLKHIRGIQPLKPFIKASSSPTRTRLTPIQRGKLFHEILQFYEFNRDTNLNTVIEQALFNQHIVDETGTIKTECQLFIQKLKNTPFIRQVLFECEQSHEETQFALKLNSLCLIGQIDKIVRIKHPDVASEWLIIDYKTNLVQSPAHCDELAKQYEFQMNCYAIAIAKNLGLKSISTMLLFTQGQQFRIHNHSEEQLLKFENHLNTLTEQLLTHSQNGNFPFTTAKSNCDHCVYFKEDYCGVLAAVNMPKGMFSAVRP